MVGMRNSINRIRPWWLLGGVLFAVLAIFLCSIVVNRVYGSMEPGQMFANTFFYASAVHFIAALILARPARRTYHAPPDNKKSRDPSAGAGRYEPAGHEYGLDRAMTIEYRVQAISFAIPGMVMFLVSFLV
jgi:putative Ca2+/H+ antiporter (TMEM165/GDT1 family)